MTEILMSIRPEWVEKILSGKKTVEVRKSAPKETPFKVYIYCTKGKMPNKRYLYLNEQKVREKYGVTGYWSEAKECLEINKGNNYEYKTSLLYRNVCAEFLCGKVTEIPPCTEHNGIHYPLISKPELAEAVSNACLTHEELFLYGVKKVNGCYGASSKVSKLYAIHISDLVIYDTPKELGEFYTQCEYDKNPCEKTFNKYCHKCNYFSHNAMEPPECSVMGQKPITRPPQSWQFVRKL